MRAVVLDGHGNHDVVDVPAPSAGPGEIVIKPGAVGVCGTDLHLVIGDYPHGRFPVIPGHEFAGEIVEVGEGVTEFAVGQRVAVDPNVSCGMCADCTTGAPNLCDSIVPVGVESNGACAELVSVPSIIAELVPEGMSDAAAALIEPLACVLHALERSPSLADRRVAVYGAGSIGLMTVIVARESGASEVHVVEPSPARRQAALDLGADTAVSPEQGVKDRSIDVAFEASGHPSAVAAAIESLDKRGTLVQMGVVSSEQTIQLRPYDLFDRELTFVGSQSLATSFSDAVTMMPRIAAVSERVVTHTYPLAEFGAAIAAAQSDSALKVHILPNA